MARISVRFGQLVSPIKTVNVNAGTTLADFCTKVSVEYGASIRVNGVAKPKTYRLHKNDLITSIGEVSGGR